MKKITIIAFFMALFANMTFAAEVNVFSARHYDSDIQLYEKFTAKTGIKVNVGSIQRPLAPVRSPAVREACPLPTARRHGGLPTAGANRY